MREVNPDKDCRALGLKDPIWTEAKFRDFLGIPGATGFLWPNGFVIGIAVEDEFFIERLAFRTQEAKEEAFQELRLKFGMVHVDLTLSKRDHAQILSLAGLGFEIWANGEMKVRLSI